MCGPLIEIELAHTKGGFVHRRRQCTTNRRIRHTRELREELTSAAADRLSKLLAVIGKEQEWRRRPELLTLKQERRGGPKQRQRRDRAVPCRRRELVQPSSEHRV